MKTDSLIFRKLTSTEFKAITNTINSEGGGSQTYIDFPKGKIPDQFLQKFFGNSGKAIKNGFEWNFYVESPIEGTQKQKATISARRDSSNSLREQNSDKRLTAWTASVSDFPVTGYDEAQSPIVLYILRSTENTFWAGWFYRKDCLDTWYMSKGLSKMIWEDCGYIELDVPISFNTSNCHWPFRGVSIMSPNISFFGGTYQKIFFGAPGTGKSHAIKKKIDPAAYTEAIRITFHPDTDYSSFVGTYKPIEATRDKYDGLGRLIVHPPKTSVKEDYVRYEYVPQAFINAYVSAWRKLVNASDLASVPPQFLIIEEINRGNCAQIFGDIFQLLDRNDDGYSSYAIDPDTEIQKYLQKTLASLSPDPILTSQIGTIYDGKLSITDILSGKKMVLPNNLFIWATMNTSDQSLFPMDSAFKRRWQWEYVPIQTAGISDNGGSAIIRKVVANNKWYDWGSIIEEVNKRIYDNTGSEDKQLGFFFCKPDKDFPGEGWIEISTEAFVGKVLFYIWTDVVKVYGEDNGKIFNTSDEWNGGTPMVENFRFSDLYGSTGVDEVKVMNILENLLNKTSGDDAVGKDIPPSSPSAGATDAAGAPPTPAGTPPAPTAPDPSSAPAEDSPSAEEKEETLPAANENLSSVKEDQPGGLFD